MNRTEALNLLRSHVRQENLRKRCLATEAMMRSLARDEESWATFRLRTGVG